MSSRETRKPRSPIRVWLERLFLVAALAFILYRLGPQFGALIGVGESEDAAPAFSFTALDGSSIDSRSLSGKVVVLNFWATWCGPCRLEMPSLQSLHEDRMDDGVVVLGLSTDGRGSLSDVTSFLDEKGITYPVGLATRAQQEAFGGVAMIPTTFLIDKSGIIRHTITGYAAPPVLRIAVSRLVEE